MVETLDKTFLEIEKKYGKGSVKFGNEIIKVPLICSSGSLKLDLALGCGGIPQKRILEFQGPPSGGKTTLAVHTLREAQIAHPDKYAAFIDLENALDIEWISKIGVDTNKLVFSQPNSGDEAFGIIEEFIKSEKFSIIVTDSVSAMITKAEIEADYGDAMMAQTARLMSLGLKKINSVMINTPSSISSLIFINQIRNRIGSYGNPEESTGGNALKFYTSIRAEVRRGDVIGDKEDPEGFITKIKLVKNKVGPPMRRVEVELYIGPEKYGIDQGSEIIDLAVQNEIIKKGGAWYTYGEERFQGKPKVVEFLNNNSAIKEEITKLVFETVLKKSLPEPGSFADITNKMEQEEEPTKKRGRKKKEEINEENFEEVNIVDDKSEEQIQEETEEN